MNNNITFEQYQDKYGHYKFPSLPEEILEKAFTKVKIGISHISMTAVQAIRGPNLVIKVAQVGIKTFSLIPRLAPHLDWTKLLLKDIKVVTNWINGLQSVNGMLNLKLSWKIITLNVSGLTLFVLSSITLAEKFLFNFTTLKTALAAIPIFGVLPFGGLLNLAITGLTGSLFLLSLDKRKKLENTAKKINEKIAFWEAPLDANKIQERQIKYDGKISKLALSIAFKEQQIIDGKQAEKTIPQDEQRKLKIHQKALEKLINVIDKENIELRSLEKKKHQWGYLGNHLNEIKIENIQSYQQAKENKWKIKHIKIGKEKKINLLSMANNIIGITKQIIIVTTVVSGVGLVALPFATLGLSLASTGISLTNYFIKKSIKEMKTSPIKMKHHFSTSFNAACAA